MKIIKLIVNSGLITLAMVSLTGHATSISSSGPNTNATLSVELTRESLSCLILVADNAVTLTVKQIFKSADYSQSEIISQTDFESEFQQVPLTCHAVETVNQAGRVTSLNCRSAPAKNQSCFLLRQCAKRIQLISPDSHVDLELALAERGCAPGQ